MKIKLGTIFLILLTNFCYAATTADDPCNQMFNIINRPGLADSACPPPPKHLMIEMGYTLAKLMEGGTGNFFPDSQIRLGLPAHTEFMILGPSYVHQTNYPYNGFAGTTLGLKHVLGFTQTWIATVEALYAPSSGSKAFGNAQSEATFNGIFSYDVTKQFNIFTVLGFSSFSQSKINGGQRFSSINPDLTLTWQPNDFWNFFGEIYGQTHTDVNEGAGFIADAGIIYLIKKNITIDCVVGQRLNGNLVGIQNYYGVGTSILF